MSFFESCENVRIEINDGSIFLHCDAQDVDGNLHPATLRLDDFIGNEDGIVFILPSLSHSDDVAITNNEY
jgi:hypothetical protein